MKKNKSDSKLSDFLCFALYSANIAMQRSTRAAFTDLGITYSQWLVLVALSEKDNQLVSEIGQVLFLESNTLTPLIKKLEKLGLVKRLRDESDERKVRVSLTISGRKTKNKTDSFFDSILDLSGLSIKEFKSLQKNIAGLRDQLAKKR